MASPLIIRYTTYVYWQTLQNIKSQVNPTGAEAALLTSECAALLASLQETARSAVPPIPLTATLMQLHHGCSNAAPADAPVLPLGAPIPPPEGGPERGAEGATLDINETMCGLTFRVSPTSFFQVRKKCRNPAELRKCKGPTWTSKPLVSQLAHRKVKSPCRFLRVFFLFRVRVEVLVSICAL
eukprot:7017488-Pyramimonas_sp.AAC.1